MFNCGQWGLRAFVKGAGDGLGEECAAGLHDLEAGCGTDGGKRGCEHHRDEHEGRWPPGRGGILG